jgi:hypothetical protein
MRAEPLSVAFVAAILLVAVTDGPLAAQNKPATKATSTASSAADRAQSGVYGISGAVRGQGSPSGAIGECIWIYDAKNTKQVAKGDCDQGNFRVPLEPGQYVVRGPGGNEKIDIKPHQWVKIRSLITLPENF